MYVRCVSVSRVALLSALSVWTWVGKAEVDSSRFGWKLNFLCAVVRQIQAASLNTL